jgi:hypothetical protein
VGIIKDLTGKEFGSLLVVGLDSVLNGRSYWKCQCSCGKTKIIYRSNLLSGSTISCGCKQKTSQFTKGINDYDLSGEYGVCYTAGDKFFLFDKEDYGRIKDCFWFPEIRTNGKVYFRANLNHGGKIYVHRLIMGSPKDSDIDHKNLDYSDCRKQSLRICSRAQNSQNQRKRKNTRSDLKGITFNKGINKWQAQITVNRKHISLGYYGTEEEAHESYCEASRKYHAEFGRLS